MSNNRQKSRIVVVDDEADVVREIATALRRHGYDVPATASSGKTAIAEATRVKPDLILMDIAMANETEGTDAGQIIHERLDIPVVYLTAYTDKNTLKRAKLSDPFGYIVKPFAEREMCIVVEMAIYRHRSEKALRDKERWFEATLNCIGDSVIATDMYSKVTFMNPLAESMTGWTRDEALGINIAEIVRLRDEHTHAFVELPDLSTLIKSRKIFFDEPVEVVLANRAGDERPISYRLALIHDNREALDGMVLSFRDITPHRTIEKQMLAAQKTEALGKMAGSIAHQFNNLLAVVAGYASSMTDHLLPNSRPYDDTLKIIEAVKHARLLTKRILGITRAANPAPDARIEPVALSVVIANAVNLVEKNFSHRRIAIVVDSTASMPTVLAEPDQIVDVLMDLFMTAADGMPDGGTITVKATRKQVRKPDPKLNPRAHSGWYGILEITDTGRGLSAEMLENIFEIFFSTRDPGMRVGFGLFAARNAINRYGGWIKAASKPWGGTIFTIFIPEGSCILRERKAVKTAVAQPRILVADDHPATLEETVAFLEQGGYHVDKAGGGEEAVALVKDHGADYDIFIVDAIMPGVGGKGTMQAILDKNPGADAIVTCGFSKDYVRSIMPPGSWRFLQKPFDREKLLELVARTLADQVQDQT